MSWVHNFLLLQLILPVLQFNYVSEIQTKEVCNLD